MPGFAPVFGETSLYSSFPTYLNLEIDEDVQLQWPIEQQIGGDLIVADIIDLTASVPGLEVALSDARQVSTGFTSLFNNVGGQTVTIVNAVGGTLVSLVSGTVWQLYLTDNTTEAGTWKVFQFGASVSVAVAAALAGAGLKAISTTLNTKISVSEKATDYVILESDRAVAVDWTAGAGAFTLPDPTTVGSDWYCIIINSGSGDLVVTPAAGLIDALASKTFPAGSSAFVICNGTNYLTLGFGGGAAGTGSFQHISIDVAGGGNYVLSGAELNKISYTFTGVLSANRTIIVPTSVQEYWVNNATTGAFSLTVKTASGTGIVVTQGTSAILYCDGTNVVIAQSTGTAFPITVGQGGTNATTASGARTNLGATATGSSLFTAVDAAAARTTIGAASAAITLTAGTGLTGGGDLSANRAFAIDASVIAPGVSNFGYLTIPQNIQAASYGLVLTDSGKMIYHANGAGAGDVYTIPANASVAFPIGTTITFVNRDGTNSIGIAITTDTLILAGIGSVGTRTLSPYGIATAVKVETTEWMISGAGLS